jgi:large subunit ribosomal protein L22
VAVAEQTREQTVRAQAKWVHSSARKARLVTDLIRGRSVPEARTILAFSQRAVAHDIEKVLRSAVANAESRPDLLWNGDDLVVVTAYADEGPTLKRWRARARGRVARIRKRTCHITLELAQSPAAVAAAAAAAEAKPRRQRAPKAEPAAETETLTETETDETTTPEPAAEAAAAPAEEQPKRRSRKKTESEDN